MLVQVVKWVESYMQDTLHALHIISFSIAILLPDWVTNAVGSNVTEFFDALWKCQMPCMHACRKSIIIIITRQEQFTLGLNDIKTTIVVCLSIMCL